LRYDSGAFEEERFVIFCTEFKACEFKNTNFVLIDATFKVTLPDFINY
jgi:hypothetical protein